MSKLNEFAIIRKFFNPYTQNFPYVKIGIGDDAASITVPPHHELVTSVDTLVEKVHFPQSTLPEDIGYKSLAVSISDMAAMGALPVAALLSLTLPSANEEWLKEFSHGFFEIADQFNLPLIGGDTTQGPLTITTVVQGLVPAGKALLRSGAEAGDLIYVTGTLGDAGLALRELATADKDLLLRLNRPQPRVDIGLALRNIASATIDISDGLVADLRKILEASGVGSIIYLDKVPFSHYLRALPKEEAFELALTAGDDYELCFTVPAEKRILLEERLRAFDCGFSCVGEICDQPELKIIDPQGKLFSPESEGYEHFK